MGSEGTVKNRGETVREEKVRRTGHKRRREESKERREERQ